MITEDYVSFETAKLLKEKGFNEKCSALYTFWFDEVEGPKEDEAENWNIEPKYFSAPTLQMAMKWLREVHHLFIGCEPRLSFTDFYWITANIYRVRKKSSLYHTEDVDDYHCVASCDSHSYEKACEEAIKYCLENLI